MHHRIARVENYHATLTAAEIYHEFLCGNIYGFIYNIHNDFFKKFHIHFYTMYSLLKSHTKLLSNNIYVGDA